jgi:hypothetical protein
MATHIEALKPYSAPQVASSAQAIPWTIWLMACACTSAIVGAHWDISWHSSIGRDDFWTPAHIAIYLCGVFGGISAGWLILSHTFFRRGDAATVNIFGFEAPLGAFLVGWGGLAMLTSAPFDDWWHNAYGLDVKIISPPHVLLLFGFFMVQVGSLVMTMGERNRAEGLKRERLERMFLYLCGLIVVTFTILILEMTTRTLMHSGLFYRTVGLLVPLALGIAIQGSGHRWAATIAAGVYTVFLLGFVWILPLFPAEPKLGPVYNPVTHFIPPQFPLLLIVPAFVWDLLRQRLAHWGSWRQAALGGMLFTLTLLAAQWPFAEFLMSDAAKNWFFGGHYYGYYIGPNSYLKRGLFYNIEKTPLAFWTVMAQAVAVSILSLRGGMALGNWIRSVQR